MRSFVLCFALFAAFAAATDVTEDEGVIVLTDDIFESVVNSNEFVLVKFYAPWCGHCKSMAPEYAKAATNLKDEGSAIKLAKLDATEHKKFSEQYQVRGYPTLKFFRNGVPMEYGGGRTSDEIINWCKKKTGPAAKTISTAEEAAEFSKSNSVTICGFFKDLECAAAKEFLKVAGGNDEYPFAMTSEQSVIDSLHEGCEDNSIVLLKDFDELKNKFEGEHTEENIKVFITANSLPLIVEFDQSTASKIFNGDIKSHNLVFLSKEDGHYEKYDEIIRPVAKKFKGKLLFVTVNTDLEDHARILDFFGMTKNEVPGVRIIKLEEDMAKYKPEKDEMTTENLEATIEKFLAGELKQNLLSQDLPEDWDKEPVKVLVSSNFDAIVFDKTKDVLVEFYAPWCGHCKQLAPIYDELAAEFATSHDDVVIAKMDATLNELEHTKIQSFPTLKLYKKETNEVVDYNGARTKEALAAFLEGKAEPEEEEEEVDEEGDVPSKDEL